MEEYFDIKDLRIGDKVIYSQKVYEIIELTKSEILIENDGVSIKVSIKEISPIILSPEFIVYQLGFSVQKSCIPTLKDNYTLDVPKGHIRIRISNLTNSTDKEWGVLIDNLDRDRTGLVEINTFNELQHFVWDCLKFEFNYK